jgi:hypothetical protein
MPLVGAGMHGYALRTEALTIFGNLYQVRIIPTARIAERGNFINVDG